MIPISFGIFTALSMGLITIVWAIIAVDTSDEDLGYRITVLACLPLLFCVGAYNLWTYSYGDAKNVPLPAEASTCK